MEPYAARLACRRGSDEHWAEMADLIEGSLRPGTPPGVYGLEVAMYSFTTGETLGVARNIGNVTVTPARRTPRRATR